MEQDDTEDCLVGTRCRVRSGDSFRGDVLVLVVVVVVHGGVEVAAVDFCRRALDKHRVLRCCGGCCGDEDGDDEDDVAVIRDDRCNERSPLPLEWRRTTRRREDDDVGVVNDAG